MKKTLLICLMGLLCLPISTLKAQSKVAESPPGTDLVYQPGIPGQEGGSSSARRGEAAPVVIYGEFMGEIPEEEIFLYTWSRYSGNGLIYKDAIIQQIDLDMPSLQRGAVPGLVRTFNSSTPSHLAPFYICIRTEDKVLLSTALVLPGDSLMIRWESSEQLIYFSGPQGRQMDLQHALYRLSQNTFTPNQTIVVNDRDEYLSSGKNLQKIEEARGLFGRQLDVVQRGSGELELLESKVMDTLYRSQIERLLASYTGDISTERIQLLRTEFLGRYDARLSKSLYRLVKGQKELLIETASAARLKHMLGRLKQRMENIYLPLSYQLGGYLENWFYLSEASASIMDQDFFEWIISLDDGDGKDVLYEYYLLTHGKQLQDLDGRVATALEEINDPIIWRNVEMIRKNRSSGVLISSDPLISITGENVGLDDFKEELVLVEFWIPGCGACHYYYQNIMKELHLHFDGDPRIRLVSVGVDKEEGRWKENEGEYYHGGGDNFFLKTYDHAVLKQLGIQSFPSFALLDQDSRILKASGFPTSDLQAWVDLLNTTLNKEFKPQSKISDL
ncbi:TlpA family protein disulfide reductase [Algoriphagus aquimarinus]|uniref:Thiol-disulfide isomerase or thioredoxin n=1 Tax=Algoriphagus aquimarinus TaxID=237018 RepID=A0A1I1APP6_9BACT|nr:hypothetical protein [Algoriphagus aquimarinus]SFB39927.1 Thiol-disulfide isomerase or thioredoxin [Algoriphagus aquimarinus]